MNNVNEFYAKLEEPTKDGNREITSQKREVYSDFYTDLYTHPLRWCFQKAMLFNTH